MDHIAGLMNKEKGLINSEPAKYKRMEIEKIYFSCNTELRIKTNGRFYTKQCISAKDKFRTLSYQSVSCFKRNMIKDSALKCYEIYMHCGSKEV